MNANLKRWANAVAVALAETSDDVPEGHLYAALMTGGADIHDWGTIRSLLLRVGFVEALPGPCLRATTRLRDALRSAKGAA